MADNSSHSKLTFSEIQTKINAAKDILILLPQNHTIDIISSGLALYLSLKETIENQKSTQRISIATPTQPTVTYQRLYGLGSIETYLGSKNLVVTLETNYETIEKITSDNLDGKLNIIIETKNEIPRLNKNDITFSYRGVNSDLILCLAHQSPEDAGQFLIQERTLFDNREIINISRDINTLKFSQTNFISSDYSSYAEIISHLIQELNLFINSDIATNLIAGIEAATNNFLKTTQADTFSTISYLLNHGGIRNHLSQSSKPNNAFANFYPSNILPKIQPDSTQITDSSNSFPNPQPIPSFPNPSQELDLKENQAPLPDEDWTQPKIYRATDLSQNNN